MGAFRNSMGAFCAAYEHALVPGACGGVVVPGRAAVSVDLMCKKGEKRIVFALLTFFTPHAKCRLRCLYLHVDCGCPSWSVP